MLQHLRIVCNDEGLIREMNYKKFKRKDIINIE